MALVPVVLEYTSTLYFIFRQADECDIVAGHSGMSPTPTILTVYIVVDFYLTMNTKHAPLGNLVSHFFFPKGNWM